MILLIDHRLAEYLPDIPIWTGSRHVVLLSSRDRRGHWISLSSNEELDSLRAILQGVPDSSRDELGKTLMVWREPDGELQAAIQQVLALVPDYPVRVSILLTGPLQDATAQLDFDQGGQDHRDGFRIASVFYLGDEDAERHEIDCPRRVDILSQLLQLLLVNDTRIIEQLGFFPRRARPAQAFSAIGVLCLSHPLSGLRELFHQEALRILKEGMRRSSTRLSAEGLESKARNMLRILERFGTPMTGPGEKSDRGRFSDALSEPAQNPFQGWACPLTRRRAIRRAERAIDLQRPEIAAYLARLRADLAAICPEVRKQGQELYAAARSELQQFIMTYAYDLGGLGLVLQHLFSPFSQLRKEVEGKVLGPCTAASSPGLAECSGRLIDDAKRQFETLAGALVRGRTLIAGILLGTALLVLGVRIMASMSLRVGFAASLVGAVTTAGVLLFAYLRARAVSRKMADWYRRGLRWIRDAYVQKVEWVVANSQRNLELQLIAHGQAIGRQIRVRFDGFFRDWERFLSDDHPNGDPRDQLRQRGIGNEQVDEYGVKVQGIVRELVQGVRDGFTNAPTPDDMHQLLSGWVLEFWLDSMNRPRSPSDQIGTETIQDALLRCARSRIEPPLLARLTDEQTLQGLSKAFLLPRSYPQETETQLLTAGLENTRLVRGLAGGPLVLQYCEGLDAKAMRASLGRSGR